MSGEPGPGAPALVDPVAHYLRALLTQGYCIIPDALPADAIGDLDCTLARDFAETPFGEGAFYGASTKRFGRLLVRAPQVAALVGHGLILDLVEAVLAPWCDCIQLNTTQAIAIHPGAPAQFPHRDQDMWRGPPGEVEYLVNVMWPLTDFTPENGATIVWPGSHGRNALAPEPENPPQAVAMVPGAALLFLGSTLHGAGANRSGEVRRGVVIGYSLGWLKPYENPWLAYPPEIARHLSPELAALAGYRQHRPNLGNYEGQCPSVLLKGGTPGALGAVDALRPDQAAIIAAHRDAQGASP